MSTLARLIVTINAVLAAASLVINVVAARYTAGRWRTLFVLIAALAALYSPAYAWLALHPDSQSEWSEVMRGLSLLVWPLVWIGPAAVMLLAGHKVRSQIAAVERSSEC